MEGDFTRNSDDLAGSYSGVLMQQGRVQLDADWNEQWAIQNRALRAALRDLIGQHGGPLSELGFRVDPVAGHDGVRVGPGIYYVDGVRVRSHVTDTVSLAKLATGSYVVFLDVWERHVNLIEDPHTREVALLGPDTASRAEVVWRVRLLELSPDLPVVESPRAAAEAAVEALRTQARRRLAARARTANPTDDPCLLAPTAQYRGRENQLYRVEIHDALVGDEQSANDPVRFTFKWSRDNGSVVFPIVSVSGATGDAPARADGKVAVTVELGHLGRDARYGLTAGDIVEFVHDKLTRGLLDVAPVPAGGPDPGRAGLLGEVTAIDPDAMTVTVTVFADDVAEVLDKPLRPYLRRWDHRASKTTKLLAGALPIRDSQLDTWLELEDGVEVRFEGKRDNGEALRQRAGDYWQIPARTVTGDVEWAEPGPGEGVADGRALRAPAGIVHHLAPLALVSWINQRVQILGRTRRTFPELAVPETP